MRLKKTQPLGTGPFKFVSYDSSQQVCRPRGESGLLGWRAAHTTRAGARDFRHERTAG